MYLATDEHKKNNDRKDVKLMVVLNINRIESKGDKSINNLVKLIKDSRFTSIDPTCVFSLHNDECSSCIKQAQ